MRHYDIKIKGRVHGVTFRWSTKQKAKDLGLHGFVKNDKSDSVYIEVEGQEEELETFIGWCHRGPFLAKVKELEFVEGEIKGYTTFEIKYD